MDSLSALPFSELPFYESDKDTDTDTDTTAKTFLSDQTTEAVQSPFVVCIDLPRPADVPPVPTLWNAPPIQLSDPEQFARLNGLTINWYCTDGIVWIAAFYRNGQFLFYYAEYEPNMSIPRNNQDPTKGPIGYKYRLYRQDVYQVLQKHNDMPSPPLPPTLAEIHPLHWTQTNSTVNPPECEKLMISLPETKIPDWKRPGKTKSRPFDKNKVGQFVKIVWVYLFLLEPVLIWTIGPNPAQDEVDSQGRPMRNVVIVHAKNKQHLEAIHKSIQMAFKHVLTGKSPLGANNFLFLQDLYESLGSPRSF
jgi:hypothetical protein